MTDTNKTFHLAITMAGAISAGAYTAGVMDFLLEALDNWTEMKQEANEFFKQYPKLKGKDAVWEDFKMTAEFTELEKSGKNLDDLKKRAIRFNAVPDHEIQIEIISGASAGGMTAAIASLVVQLENKHHVKFLPDEKEPATLKALDEIRGNNRLYNSWVNLTSSDMLSVLLGDSDIKIARKPVAALNSQFIRQVSERALQIDETDNILHAPYVAEDFNLFVTLTNLEGYQKSLNIDSSGQRAEADNYGDFITYNHSDLIMFSFGENKDPGTVHIDFNRENDPLNDENIRLLSDAAVATGAFPIGLEYASFSRKAEFINDNFLINQIHSDTKELVEKDKNYLTTFIDGGLINNEPFELTDCLLKEKLKLKLKKRSSKEYLNDLDKKFRDQLDKEFPNGLSDEELKEKLNGKTNKWFETEVRKQKNYTILMIDPFPSEKKPPKVEKPTGGRNYYPFDLLGVLGQLIYTMRSQLLVKTSLFNTARDVTDFSCYLIAPRRRRYEKTKDGKLLLDDQQRPIPVYEKDDHGKIVTDG
ncbi:MAG: patatin-like phospholipase family protein, partial [Acidobacteriota bacterium]|nr:patatin-like phospholipase family protein [Acidobacteriota bacterium]